MAISTETAYRFFVVFWTCVADLAAALGAGAAWAVVVIDGTDDRAEAAGCGREDAKEEEEEEDDAEEAEAEEDTEEADEEAASAAAAAVAAAVVLVRRGGISRGSCLSRSTQLLCR